ncbi:galactose-specific lectin nattectin-like [Sphaeramia orbicularis]|nr:galactose-specific lectin nattectin-like [Sphaeramia orbicularis]
MCLSALKAFIWDICIICTVVMKLLVVFLLVGSMMVLSEGRLKWTDAQKHCLSMGGNLLSVHNAQQNNQALSLLGNNRTWIAGSDAQEEGQWLNVDGTPFNYTNWCSGQPDNHGGRESCAEVNFSGRRCWNDFVCTKLLYSICATTVNP